MLVIALVDKAERGRARLRALEAGARLHLEGFEDAQEREVGGSRLEGLRPRSRDWSRGFKKFRDRGEKEKIMFFDKFKILSKVFFLKKCQEMSGNVKKCQEMSRNVKKCQEMTKNCQEMSGIIQNI